MKTEDNKCDKGWYNCECCCNCKHQLKLMKHPMNKDFGKGSIMEQCGYVCTTPFDDGSNAGNGIFSDRQHGMCEMHEPK